MEINDPEIKCFLSDVKSKQNMLCFLTSRRHPVYHHFISFSTLEDKLKNKTWGFTSGKNKNDYHEYDEKSNPGIRDNILSTSFSWGDEDNMAMWSMYCNPREDAVRISFNAEAMHRWLGALRQKQTEQCNDVCQWFQNRERLAQAENQILANSDQEKNIGAVFLHDIVYFLGYQDNRPENKLCWGSIEQPAQGNTIVNDIRSIPEMTGFVKNSAWSYEQESRLSIYFNRKPKDLYLFRFSDEDWEYILCNSQISFGPWTPLFRFEERKREVLGWIDNPRIREHFRCNAMMLRNSYFSARVKMCEANPISPRKRILELLEETIRHADVYRRCGREMIPDGGGAQFIREMQQLAFRIDCYNRHYISKREDKSDRTPSQEAIGLADEFIKMLESNSDKLQGLYPVEVIDELKAAYFPNR